MKKFLLLFIILYSHSFSSQKLDIDKLGDKIYEFNNKLEYKKSQDTLLTLLQKEDVSPNDKVQLNILMSFTFKRLQDYVSVLYYLQEAKKIATQNNLQGQFNPIEAQFAYAYFDTQDFKKSREIMDKISAQNYKNLSPDDKSKILMQEGYISFLDKDFAKAESFYASASSLMQKYSACDLPIIYGKQIQLYFVQKNPDKALQLYKTGIQKAKSCKILKYEMYLTEVLINIYKDTKDAENALKFGNKYDSLAKIYNSPENLSKLHLEKEILAQKSEEEQKKSKWIIIAIYSLATLLLLAVIFFVVRYAIQHRNKNREHNKTIEEMKQMLINYEDKKNNNSVETALNSKQAIMVQMLKDGKTNKEIAKYFNLSEDGVKYHIKKVYEILKINNRKELKGKM